MSRMIRKQVYIEPSQDEAIKRRSRELGVSESDLLRRGLDQITYIVTKEPRDAAAWAAELAFIHERAAPGSLEPTWLGAARLDARRPL